VKDDSSLPDKISEFTVIDPEFEVNERSGP